MSVPSGTIVDKGVTLSYGFDFYLNAHIALQVTIAGILTYWLREENEDIRTSFY